MWNAQTARLLEYQNFLQHYSSCLSFLHNYFDAPTKLFSDFYLPTFLDTSAKSFFPHMYSPNSVVI